MGITEKQLLYYYVVIQNHRILTEKQIDEKNTK